MNAVAAHLEVCEHCRQEAHAIKRIILALHPATAAPVPPELVERAGALLQHRPSPQPRPSRRFQISWLLHNRRAPTGRRPQRTRRKPRVRWREQLRITLLFDSLKAPTVMGVRATGSKTRRLIFRFDTYQLDLRVRAHGSLRRVTGQLLGYEGVPPALSLRTSSAVVQSTVSPLMEYEFQDVPAGRYELTVRLAPLDEVFIELEL